MTVCMHRKKYAKVSPSAFGLNKGKKRIAVIRAGGAIVGGGGGGSGQIKADDVIKQLRQVEKDKVGFFEDPQCRAHGSKCVLRRAGRQCVESGQNGLCSMVVIP